ncbi:hypothetical protein [Paenibacillus cremeus]|uniref:Uncharacterized protein n=1 Tax=Paenibacillus cremeus TaxID=2163881 RepID=A0A559KCH2_9BACL|nr:hypothetical protein [Paenibacillus cremeus]TVY09824.1 hypothetical protein FPZ49_10640 [Paenibacillus cremeus]
MQSFDEYVKEMIDKGYIAKDGKPLKCYHCESTNFDEKEYYLDGRFIVIEKVVTCKDCNIKVGQWSYGTWEI